MSLMNEKNICKWKYMYSLICKGEHVKFSKCNISIQTIVSTLAVKVLTPHSKVYFNLDRFMVTHTFRFKIAILCKEDGHDKNLA